MSDELVQDDLPDMNKIMANDSSIILTEEHTFEILLSQKIWVHLCLQYMISVVHAILVIPSNVFTLFVILKSKSLWNYSNVILAINAFFLAIGSFLTLFLRQAHFPFVLYGKQERAMAYAALWWVCSLTFRIGNNSYMMLAFFRYISVCLQANSWFSKQTSLKPTTKKVSIILIVMLTPSIIWTASMFFGCPAAGKVWNFELNLNSTNSSLIFASQEISFDNQGRGQTGITVMAFFLVFQLLVTLCLYIKICRTSFMSSMNISLKRKHSANVTSENIVVSNVACASGDVSLGQIKDKLKTKMSSDKSKPKLKLVKSISISESNLQKNFTSYENVPKRSQSCRKVMFKRSSSKKTQTGPLLSHGGSNINTKIRSNHLLTIPLSKRVVYVSRKDIFCTSSLTLQILCLLMTHGLTIFAFKISGQKVSLTRFIFSYYAFELAFLINTMIHPLICILFSSNYRDAAKNIIHRFRCKCL